MTLSFVTQPSFGKYVYTYSGTASHTWFTTKIVTDIFRLTTDAFVDEETGEQIDEVKSESLHGVGITEVNGVPTVNPSDDEISENDLTSLTEKVFTVQNASDYDLVACFDIILCMGLLNNPTVTCTVTEESSGTELKVTAAQSGGDVKLIRHKESATDSNGEEPIINVEITNLWGLINYKAYSTHIDPKEFKGTAKLTEDEFENFIIVRSGETKTFSFSVSSSGADAGALDKNCYASMTMTVKKYSPS